MQASLTVCQFVFREPGHFVRKDQPAVSFMEIKIRHPGGGVVGRFVPWRCHLDLMWSISPGAGAEMLDYRFYTSSGIEYVIYNEKGIVRVEFAYQVSKPIKPDYSFGL